MSTLTQDHNYFVETTFPQLVNQLRELIYQIDAKRVKRLETIGPLIKDCEELSKDYFEASSLLDKQSKNISTILKSLSEKLTGHSRVLSAKLDSKEITTSWNLLSENYEVLIKEVKRTKFSHQNKKDFHHIIPTNYYRNAFHIGNALFIAGLYHYVVAEETALIILTLASIACISAEIYRRYSESFNDFLVYKVFKMVARPQEKYRVNSATYYISALTCMAWLTPKAAFINSLLILGISDPMANIFGKKFGKTKIYKQKSLQGCIAFFISAFTITIAANSLVLSPEFGIFKLISFSLILGIAGTIIELFSERLDDNLTIIIGCSLIAWFIL
jgi:dolichol kinase